MSIEEICLFAEWIEINGIRAGYNTWYYNPTGNTREGSYKTTVEMLEIFKTKTIRELKI